MLPTKTFKLAPENYQISLQMSAFQHAHSLVTGMFFFKENVKKKEKKSNSRCLFRLNIIFSASDKLAVFV